MRQGGSSGSVGLAGLVFVVLLTLKLAGVGAVAAWSWWWVTAPLWGSAALAVLLILVYLVITELSDD